jgi:hypothetical protein
MAAAVHKLLHPHSHSRSHHGHQDSRTADEQHPSHAQPSADDPHQQQAQQPSEHKEESEAMARGREDEKNTLAQWGANKQPLSPDEIHKDPDRKILGHTSRVLRQEDFELIKTLGTGMPFRRSPSNRRTFPRLLMNRRC